MWRLRGGCFLLAPWLLLVSIYLVRKHITPSSESRCPLFFSVRFCFRRKLSVCRSWSRGTGSHPTLPVMTPYTETQVVGAKRSDDLFSFLLLPALSVAFGRLWLASLKFDHRVCRPDTIHAIPGAGVGVSGLAPGQQRRTRHRRIIDVSHPARLLAVVGYR